MEKDDEKNLAGQAELPDAPSVAMNRSLTQWQQHASLATVGATGISTPSVAHAREDRFTNKIVTVMENDDDLAYRMNGPEFKDGGMRSNQSSLSTSAVLARPGMFNGATFTGMVAVTTITGWGGVKNIEPAYKGKYIEDRYDATEGEDYKLTAAFNQRIPMSNNDNSLDLGLRVDGGIVTGVKHIQETWHGLGMAHYYRSMIDTVQSKPLINTEITGAYSVAGTHGDKVVYTGVSLGNGYHGGMLGLGFETGTRDARFMPVTTHSAQFGNSNIEHAVPGWDIRPGTVKLSGFAKVYVSGAQDYRTTASADNPLTHDTTRTLAVDPHHFSDIYTYTAYDGDVPVPQFKIRDDGRTSLTTSMPAAVQYSARTLNTEIGATVKLQVTRNTTLTGSLTGSSVLANAKANPQFSNEIAAEHARLSKLGNYLLPFTDSKTGATAYQSWGYGDLMYDKKYAQSITAVLDGPTHPNLTYNATVGISYAFGGKRGQDR